jgi:hypothetical protein
VAASRVQAEPDATIGDLIRRLTDDSKRLVRDEVRLAKLEIGENLRADGRIRLGTRDEVAELPRRQW